MKYIVVDKLGVNYSVAADWELHDKDDNSVTFYVRDTLGNPKAIAQFTKANIIGFYNFEYCNPVKEHGCEDCKYEHLDNTCEPCNSCNDNCNKWEAKEPY